MIASELKRVISALESPLILESSVIDDTVYGLKLKGENREWNISLIFPELFPHTLPKAKLLDTDKIGSIPHVNQSGVICVEESDSILLDSSRPKDIIDHFINDTVKLLDKANLKIYQDELLNEIEGYFNFDNKVNSFYVATDKTEHVRLKLQKSSNKTLQEKPVLLVGHDNDLNMVFSNYSKVSALALSLQSDLPYIKVKKKAVVFDSVTSDADFLSSDIVVVAVGSPSLNLHINKKIKALNFNAAIFCWNEASGYGGHSVALALKDTCLECIYTNEYGFSMDHGLSLVTPGQEISKNLTGCAGVFTPFSYLDSSQTAAIAAKQCINMLSGKTRSNAMSWKGEDRYGLKVTDRFNTMPLKEEIDLIKAKKCRACNEG